MNDSCYMHLACDHVTSILTLRSHTPEDLRSILFEHTDMNCFAFQFMITASGYYHLQEHRFLFPF